MILFICGALYWPGLSGDFFLDDYPHIVHNKAIQLTDINWQALWTAANSTNSGPLGRPLALVSFALNYHFTALDPFFFKLVNLFLHLLTGIGVFLLVRHLAARLGASHDATNIALLTAALWLLHPLNVSTVLYAVQRMTGLASLLIIWGMVAYCHGRECLLSSRQSGWNWILLGLAMGGIGMFAKETAVLMLGYLLVIEGLAYRFTMPSPWQRHALQAAYALAIGLPIAWVLITRLLAPGWIEGAYANRQFTLDERLLTQSRVLWDYLSLTWLPNIQAMGLYHDGYETSRSLFKPLATFITLVIHTALIVSAWLFRKRWPLLLLATAWFYVGHSAEATLLPLEIKYEHRNYLPMAGWLLLMAHGIYRLTVRLQNTRKVRAVIVSALLLTFGGSTLVRASQFGDYWGFSGMEAEHHPESSRANQGAAMSLMKLMLHTKTPAPELIEQSAEYLRRAARANPNSTAPLFTGILFLPEITSQPPPNELMIELTNRLSHVLPDANINSYFLGLLRQAEDGKLRLTHQQVHALFQSIEANPHITPHMQADILAIRATYVQSIEHDNAMARNIIDRAITMAPDLSGIHVPAIWIYQEAGLWQDSARLLQHLKKLDTHGLERNSIAWLSQRQIKHQ